MENIEIEIKVQVENAQPLRDFVAKEAKKTGEQRQVDEYFTPAHRDFFAVRPTPEWLRLRTSDGKNSMNYKHFYHDESGKSAYCDEYETPIGDIAQAELIFKALNMQSRVTVDKVRATYHYKDYEIALDHIEGLGDFVEIEYKSPATKEDAARIKQEMITFLKNLNVGKVYLNHSGYPFQILFPKETILEEY